MRLSALAVLVLSSVGCLSPHYRAPFSALEVTVVSPPPAAADADCRRDSTLVGVGEAVGGVGLAGSLGVAGYTLEAPISPSTQDTLIKVGEGIAGSGLLVGGTFTAIGTLLYNHDHCGSP